MVALKDKKIKVQIWDTGTKLIIQLDSSSTGRLLQRRDAFIQTLQKGARGFGGVRHH